MRTSSVVDEPEFDGQAVILRVVVEDPDVGEEGGVFVCRMTGYDDVAVESFPLGNTPSSDAESRVDAAAAARRYALENREQFDALFASLPG